MLFEVRSLVQNRLMGVPAIAAFTERLHSTGINGDPEVVSKTLGAYVEHIDIRDKDILELGPGQSPQVLELAKASGARRCVAVDTHVYPSAAAARLRGIDVHAYDGVTLPFGSNSFDVVWSSSVLEHVRDPEQVVRECVRVLRPGGQFLARIDLRDHYRLHEESRWLDCLRYSDLMWLLMTSNRSSFVNRLRFSDWQGLFGSVGLRAVAVDQRRSQILAAAHAAGLIPSYRHLSAEDAVIAEFLGVYVLPVEAEALSSDGERARRGVQGPR